jgi:hypothetical protein
VARLHDAGSRITPCSGTRTLHRLSTGTARSTGCASPFDSPAVYGALLDTNNNGRWRIGPVKVPIAQERRYTPGQDRPLDVLSLPLTNRRYLRIIGRTLRFSGGYGPSWS